MLPPPNPLPRRPKLIPSQHSSASNSSTTTNSTSSTASLTIPWGGGGSLSGGSASWSGVGNSSSGDENGAGPSRLPTMGKIHEGVKQRGEKSGRMMTRNDKVHDISTGCLAGKKMRFSLTVMQEPVHGRRKTEKDRRPLAHCPILRFRMREVHQAPGSTADNPSFEEKEVDVSTVEPVNYICAAELFEVDPSPSPAVTDTPRSLSTTRMPSRSTSSLHSNPGSSSLPDTDMAGGEEEAERAGTPSAGRLVSSKTSLRAVDRDVIHGSALSDSGTRHPPDRPSIAGSNGNGADSGADALTNDNMHAHDDGDTLKKTGIPRTAGDRSSGSSGDGDSGTARPSSKRPKQVTIRNLFGSLHVPAVRVIAPEGDMGLWFLFTDLTARIEGTFTLRFRVFDITAADKVARTAAPILVEAWSHPFKVYSPRHFPGLPKPTELAEHFGRQGFKLNTRKNERQAKTPPPELVRPNPAPLQAVTTPGSRPGHHNQAHSQPRAGESSETQQSGGSGSTGTIDTSSSSWRSVPMPSPLSRSFGDPDR